MKQKTVPSTTMAQPPSSIMSLMAKGISYLCHPIFMPLVVAVVLAKVSPQLFAHIAPGQLNMWFLSIGITGVFFPLVSILLMKQLGFIQSIHMHEAKERTAPLMATMIFYFWLSHVFNSIPKVEVPLIYKVLFLGNLWGVILVFIINIFTKVSMHTAAAGGLMGILIVLGIVSVVPMWWVLLPAAAIAAIVGYARWILKAHQSGDIFLGYIVGMLVQVAAWVYYLI